MGPTSRAVPQQRRPTVGSLNLPKRNARARQNNLKSKSSFIFVVAEQLDRPGRVNSLEILDHMMTSPGSGHLGIDMNTGHTAFFEHENWASKQGAVNAAKMQKGGSVGRLVGFIRLSIKTDFPEELWSAVQQSRVYAKRGFDDDGEYPTKAGVHIPITRVMDMIYSKDAELVGKLEGNEGYQMLQTIYSLQAPQSCPWKRPMLRTLSYYYVHPSKNSVSGKKRKTQPAPEKLPKTKKPKKRPQKVTLSLIKPAAGFGFGIVNTKDQSGVVLERFLIPQKAGSDMCLEIGDKIISAGGKKVRNTDEIQKVLKKCAIGTQVDLVVEKKAKPEEEDSSISQTKEFEDSPEGVQVEVLYMVYFSRLLFELVADPAIHSLMPYIIPVRPITNRARPSPTAKQPVIWKSTVSHKSDENLFNLVSVMKTAESKGYAIRDPVPDTIKTQLFEYQRSSLQWMLDHERDDVGLNGYFWEEREWGDQGYFYYFPLAGEFRLTKPPKTTGGLLCEEMGLGKTLEILCLILANPLNEKEELQASSLQSEEVECFVDLDNSSQINSKATVIIAPLTLIGQWFDEIKKHVAKDGLQVLTLANLPQVVPASTVTFLHDPVGSSNYPLSLRCNAEVLLPYCTRPLKVRAVKAGTMNGNEACQITYTTDDFTDWDVILTTYDVLSHGDARGFSVRRILKSIHWHRCVLDECQEIKTPTTQIAQMCANISVTHRWMVSGTPLHTSTADFHGELNFLKIWPFSLQNDGFWERKIQEPFEAKDPSSLPLLHALIDICMMRHSKSQTYLDGRPLVHLPSRSLEWVPVDFRTGLAGDSDAFIYWFLEMLFTKEIGRIQDTAIETNIMPDRRVTNRMRAYFMLLQRAATDPACLKLEQVDQLVRRIMGTGFNNNRDNTTDNGIPALTADEVLRMVQLGGAGRTGGLNRDVGRSWAILTKAEQERTEELNRMSLKELQDLLVQDDLPVPKSWAKLVDVTVTAQPGHDYVKTSTDCTAMIAVGDVLRLGAQCEENEVLVKAVDQSMLILDAPLRSNHFPGYFQDVQVFKRVVSTRKQPFIEILLARDKESSGIKKNQINEAGFSTIYKLIAKEEVQCPICMVEVMRPTVTRCVHLFCQDCILLEVNEKVKHNMIPKCPICRRDVKKGDLMEVKLQDAEEEIHKQDTDLPLLKNTASSVEAVTDTSQPSTLSNKQSSRCKSPQTKVMSLDLAEAFQPAATESMLATCREPYTVDGVGPAARDHMLPSLSPTFLWHNRFCQMKHSSKITALRLDMEQTLERDKTSKFIIFSQYSDVVRTLLEVFTAQKVGCELICGGISRIQRLAAVSNFQNDPTCKIILLTTGTAAAGLTLTAANTLYLLEPCCSVLDEAQALSRAHRIGARENVRCVIFYMTGSVDHRLLVLRKAQGTLIDLNEDSDILGTESDNIAEEPNQAITAGFSFEQLKGLVGMQPL